MSPTKPPAQAVSPLGRRSVKTLQARAVKERLRWVHADCSAARSKRDVMATLARAFALPAHFGGSVMVNVVTQNEISDWLQQNAWWGSLPTKCWRRARCQLKVVGQIDLFHHAQYLTTLV